MPSRQELLRLTGLLDLQAGSPRRRRRSTRRKTSKRIERIKKERKKVRKKERKKERKTFDSTTTLFTRHSDRCSK